MKNGNGCQSCYVQDPCTVSVSVPCPSCDPWQVCVVVHGDVFSFPDLTSAAGFLADLSEPPKRRPARRTKETKKRPARKARAKRKGIKR